MEVTWLGRNCFRIRGREGSVVTDPCPPDSGYKFAKPQADLITLSRKDDPGYSDTSVVAGDARVLDAPGEYEIGGILVTGVATKTLAGERNIAFVIELDGIRVGHLGLIGGPPTAAQVSQLGKIDVLLLPSGGGNSLNAKGAQDVMTGLDPAMAIPMNFKTANETLDLEPIEAFQKESGAKPDAVARLQISRTQVPEQLEIVVLEPRG